MDAAFLGKGSSLPGRAGQDALLSDPFDGNPRPDDQRHIRFPPGHLLPVGLDAFPIHIAKDVFPADEGAHLAQPIAAAGGEDRLWPPFPVEVEPGSALGNSLSDLLQPLQKAIGNLFSPLSDTRSLLRPADVVRAVPGS